MKARRVKKLDPAAPLVENVARFIDVRLEELQSFVPAALEPDNVGAQHDMRIAAKRLRYLLETTGFCFGKPAEVAAKRARNLQTLLGELHDCDALLPRIESHAAELRAQDAAAVRAKAGAAVDLDPRLAARAGHRTTYRGLAVLAVHVQARRRLHFDRFVAFWREQEEAGTWARLERAVGQRLREARERRESAERVARAQRAFEKAEQDRSAAAQRAERAAAELAAAQVPPPRPADGERFRRRDEVRAE